MKLTIRFTAGHGYNAQAKIGDLAQNEDFLNYLSENANESIVMTLKKYSKEGTKERMFSYYNGVLIHVAVQAFTDAGYELMDQVKADYMLKAEFAKGTIVGPEGEEVYLLDKSKMTKERLHKFISDCVFFLEDTLGVKKVPNSEEYKSLKETGDYFKSIKYEK